MSRDPSLQTGVVSRLGACDVSDRLSECLVEMMLSLPVSVAIRRNSRERSERDNRRGMKGFNFCCQLSLEMAQGTTTK